MSEFYHKTEHHISSYFMIFLYAAAMAWHATINFKIFLWCTKVYHKNLEDYTLYVFTGKPL